MKKLILFLILFIPFLNSYSQSICCPYMKGISFNPPFPNSNDNIQIITTTMCPSLGNLVSYQYNISNDSINLQSCYFSGVAAQPQTYTDTTTIGKLPSGTYLVFHTAFITDNPNNCDYRMDTNVLSKLLYVKSEIDTATISNSNFSIYPNPSKSVFELITHEKDCSFVIYDLFGNLVRNGNFDFKVTVSMQSVSKGNYLIKISSSTKSVVSKLIIL